MRIKANKWNKINLQVTNNNDRTKAITFVEMCSQLIFFLFLFLLLLLLFFVCFVLLFTLGVLFLCIDHLRITVALTKLTPLTSATTSSSIHSFPGELEELQSVLHFPEEVALRITDAEYQLFYQVWDLSCSIAFRTTHAIPSVAKLLGTMLLSMSFL